MFFCDLVSCRRYAAVSASLLALAVTSPAALAVESNSSVIGDWRLVKVLDSVDITSLDDKGASSLLGKLIKIRKDGARFESYKCQPPDLESTRVVPDLYLRKEAGIDNSRLKLPNPVTVFDISRATVFVKSRDRVVLTWDGYFFQAERAGR